MPGTFSYNDQAYKILPLPVKAIMLLCFALAFIVILLINSWAEKIFHESSVPQLILGFLLIGIWIIIYIRILKPYRERLDGEFKSEQMILWQNALEKWNVLYYCERDDLVFDPDDQGAYAAAREMNRLLYG
jgi:hypothetical protein